MSATSADAAVSFELDDASRVVEQTTTPLGGWGGVPSTVAFDYDAAGRLTGIDDGTVTTTYGYDHRGRLRSVDDSGAGGFGFDYDLAGNLSTLVRPNGVVETRTYDPSGLVTDATASLGGTVLQRLRYGYDGSARRSELVDSHGTHTYGHDAIGQLTSVDHPLLLQTPGVKIVGCLPG